MSVKNTHTHTTHTYTHEPTDSLVDVGDSVFVLKSGILRLRWEFFRAVWNFANYDGSICRCRTDRGRARRGNKKKIKNSDVNVLIWHRFLIARFGGPYARRDPPKQTRRDECVFVFADDVRQRRKLIFRRKNVVDATDTNGRLMKYKFKRYIYINIYIRTGIYRTFSSRYVCS